ncbi:MAG: FxLYD domain-containing protein [Atopobiaceae bacterium]
MTALYNINEASAISVASSEQSNLDDVLTDGKTANTVTGLMNSASFTQEESENSGTYKTYSAVVENTSDITFSYFSMNISLEDADGVVVDTQTTSTQSWDPGSKHRFQFSTNAEFTKIDVASTSWAQ